MVFEQIEQLKQDYTDKYVVVDASRPELRRFEGMTGVVRTVNMSGRALVEFLEFHLNIGWHDISLDFLKVIDEPLPKPEKETKKAPAKAKAKETPAAKGGDKPKMSVEDMMAAARGEKSSGAAKTTPKKEPAKPAAGMSVADMLAAARGEKSGAATPAAKKEDAPTKKEDTPAKKDDAPKKTVGKMSVEEMLAAARSEKSGGGASQAEPEPEPVEEPVEEETVAEEPAATPDEPKKKYDASKMTVEEILAAARAEKQ